MKILQKLRRHKVSEESSSLSVSVNNGRQRSSRRARRSLRADDSQVPFSALSPTSASPHLLPSSSDADADSAHGDGGVASMTPTPFLIGNTDGIGTPMTPTAVSAPSSTTPLSASSRDADMSDGVKGRRLRMPAAMTPDARSTRARSAGRTRGHSRSTSWVAPHDLDRALADLKRTPLALRRAPDDGYHQTPRSSHTPHDDDAHALALLAVGTTYGTPPPLSTELSPSEGVLSNASDGEGLHVYQKENLLELQQAQQRLAAAVQSSVATLLTSSSPPHATPIAPDADEGLQHRQQLPHADAAASVSPSVVTVTPTPLPALVGAAAIAAKNAALPTFNDPPRSSESQSQSKGTWVDVPLVSPEAVDDNDDDLLCSNQREGSTHWQLPSTLETHTPGAWIPPVAPHPDVTSTSSKPRSSTPLRDTSSSRAFSPSLERKLVHSSSHAHAAPPERSRTPGSVSPRSLRSSMKHLRSKTVVIRDDTTPHSRQNSRGSMAFHTRQRSDTDIRPTDATTPRGSLIQPSLTGELSQAISTQVQRSNTDIPAASSTSRSPSPPATPNAAAPEHPSSSSPLPPRQHHQQQQQQRGMSSSSSRQIRRPRPLHVRRLDEDSSNLRSANDDKFRRNRGELDDSFGIGGGMSGDEPDLELEGIDEANLPPKRELTARALDTHDKFSQYGSNFKNLQEVKVRRALEFVESVQAKPEVNNIELFENIEKIRTRLRKLQGETGRLQHERIEHLFKTICSSPPLLRRLYLILQENNIPSSASAVAAASSSSSLSSYAHEQFVDAPPELREFANAPPPALALGGAGVVGHRHGGGRRPAASMRRHQRRRDGAGTTAHLGNVEQHEHHDDGHDGILNGLKSAPVSSTPARDDASEWQSTSLPMHTSSRPSTLSRSQSSRRHRSRNRDRSPDVPPFSNRATRSSSRHRHHGGGGGDPSSSPGGGVVPPRPNLPRHSRSVSRTFSRNGTTSSGPRASYHSFLDFSATLKSEMLFLADSLTHERQSASEAEQCIVQLMNLVINYQTQILENQNAEWDINEISTNFSLRIAELEETKEHLEFHIREQEHQKKELEYAVFLAEQEARKYAAQAANTALREASLSARLRRKSHGSRSSASASSHRRVSSSRSSLRMSKPHNGEHAPPVLSGLPLTLSDEKSSENDAVGSSVKPSISREASAVSNFADCSPPLRPELSVSASVPTLGGTSSGNNSRHGAHGALHMNKSKPNGSGNVRPQSKTPLLLPLSASSRTPLDLAPVLVETSLSVSMSRNTVTNNNDINNSANNMSNRPQQAAEHHSQSISNNHTSSSRNAPPVFFDESKHESHSHTTSSHTQHQQQQPVLHSNKPSSSSARHHPAAEPSPLSMSIPPLSISHSNRRPHTMTRSHSRSRSSRRQPLDDAGGDSTQPSLAPAPIDPRLRRAGARHLRHGRSTRENSHNQHHRGDNMQTPERSERAQGPVLTRRGEDVVGSSRSMRRSSSRSRVLDDPSSFDLSLSHGPPLGTPDSARMRFSPSKVIELEKRLDTLHHQHEELEMREDSNVRHIRDLREALHDAEQRCDDAERRVGALEATKTDAKKGVGVLQARVKAEADRCAALQKKFENLKFQFHYGDTEKDKRIDDLSKKLERCERAGRKEQLKAEELMRRCKRLEARLDKVKNKRVATWIMEIDDPEVAASRRKRREAPEPAIQTHEIFYEEMS